MNRQLVYVLGGGAAVLAATVWLLYPRPPRSGERDYRFMHCPKCGTEFAYNPDLAGKPCSRCAGRHLYVPTTESVAATGGPRSPFARMFVPLLLEVNVLLALIWYVSRRPRGGGPEEEDYFYTRCPCNRKLRYPARSAGRQGRCPGCKRTISFPAVPAEEDA